jgi:adenylate kinase family enzyme
MWWIGGVTCSGKTTIAGLIARQFNARVYSTDDTFDQHARNASCHAHPTMHSYQNDEDWGKWVRGLSPVEASRVWLQFYRERISMILDDLSESPGGSTVVEGVDLLPELVLPRVSLDLTVWLVPTRRFFFDHYAEREWVQEEPDEATWEYYKLMIQHVKVEAEARGGRVVEIDGSSTSQEVASDLLGFFTTSAP